MIRPSKLTYELCHEALWRSWIQLYDAIDPHSAVQVTSCYICCIQYGCAKSNDNKSLPRNLESLALGHTWPVIVFFWYIIRPCVNDFQSFQIEKCCISCFLCTTNGNIYPLWSLTKKKIESCCTSILIDLYWYGDPCVNEIWSWNSRMLMWFSLQ